MDRGNPGRKPDGTPGREDEQASGTTGEHPAAFSMPRPSPTLTALTTSALALPGIAGSARAEAPIERATASYSFSAYLEDKLSPRKFEPNTGSRQRYEVYTDQIRIDAPISERMDIGIDFLYEEMSGASPWFVTFDPTRGATLQVMSGATITDTRVDLAMDVDYYLDDGKDTFSAGFSKENDYLSIHGGLGAERQYNDKNTTLNFSGAFAYDWIEPTGGGTLGRPVDKTKWSLDLFAGVAQILSRASTTQLTVNFKHSDGYLADPYKLIQILSGPNIPDGRPSTKEQVSLLARYRHHFEDVEGSLHVDYRFYFDDWSVVSHTIEIGWYQTVFDWLTITPSARWYSQSKADFYEPFLNALLTPSTAPADRSSDYRLSPYGAVSARLKADIELKRLWEYDPSGWAEMFGITDGLDLILSASYERYFSDGNFALESLGEFEQAPGLVDFQLISASVSARF